MKECIYCGNNPVPHAIHKFYQSMDVALGPVRRTVAQSFLGRAGDYLTSSAALGILHVLKPLGLVQINRDIEKIPYPRAKVLWEEAQRRTIPIEEIKLFGKSIDLYSAQINNKKIYFLSLPRRENVETSNLSWIDDKYLLKKKLAEHNLPVPKGGTFTKFSQALKEFEKLEKPVIVKPRTGSRGRHTTTLIYDKDDLKEAFRIAKQICHWVIMEEHLFGDIQRGTVIGGKLVGVLGGSSPKVTGDGKSTIAELIEITDQNRPTGVKQIKINPYFMQRQKLNMDSVLPEGKQIYLSEKIGVNYGGTSYDCTDECHPDTKKMLEEAGKVLNLSILGFDFIIPDITKSYKEQKSGIIECNGAPFIQLHHDPLYGKSINAAKYVWDLIV
ncbi:MAG TPA: ATP-grasp domain-containing protein [Methylomirabilota bacterium]|nr:ATP-grasp domain-containing protein [Methylomirabilota bacterium]